MSARSSTEGGESLPNDDQARDVEKAQIGANATAEQESKKADAELVDWDGPNDPEDPQNW
jgi:hypothetical protein